MADCENPLPADEDLFEQPPQLVSEPVVEQNGPQTGLGEGFEPQNVQPVENRELVEQMHDSSTDEQPSAESVPEQEHETAAPQGIPFLDDPQPATIPPLFHQPEPQQNFFDETEAPARIRTETLFQPAAYVAPIYVTPQPRSSDEYSEEGTEGIVENGTDEPGQHSKLDADEHTIWIDSEPEDETEAKILRKNFYLPYSDHNYDCADPEDRVTHPIEGPFPIIDGLDDFGNITKQYMPGEEPTTPQDGSLSPGPSSAMLVQEHSQQQQIIPQHQQVPHRQVIHMNRPVGTAPPFSVGGSEFHQRSETGQQRINQSREPNYRMVNEFANGLIPARTAPIGQRVLPTTAIIRGGRPEVQGNHQNMYQSPQHPLATSRVSNTILHRRPIPSNQQQHPAPGSYQHIQHPTPGAIRRGGNIGNIGRMQPGIMGARQAVRPIQVARPMEVHDREFADNPHALQPSQSSVQPPPVQRRNVDVAPHRMTQEQRQEQQQLVRTRPAAHFPIIEPQQQNGSPAASTTQITPPTNRVLGPGRLLVRGQGPHPSGTGVLVRGRAISGTDDILRSPQRAMEQSPQQQPLIESPPRKFHIKVTDSYSAPIPKVSDQLPAQLTEDPPEDEPQSAIAPEQVSAQERPGEVPPAQLLEEEREPSRHSSPVKPTPPHRLPQEEKSAHFARLMADKEGGKSASSLMHHAPALGQQQHAQHLAKSNTEIPSATSALPLRSGHQDDTLAMVQSVFDSTKPRLPDTPKDKEAISKIADHLRFSAEKYETNKIPDASRRRNDSAMSHGSQGHNYHHDVLGMERDDSRRKRQNLPRYDLQHPQNPQHPQQSGSSSMLRPQDQHLLHLQQPSQQSQLEPPHRSRGRPKGTSGPPRNRFGTDAVAPHRIGGARTLPPRNQAPTTRNGGAAENSDSESEGIEEETWTMRCYCGMTHPTGLSLECEKCKTWQHTFCMGLKANSNTDGYLCELCLPRQLPISKAEAIRIQKKEIAKIKKTEKKDKKRKSEPPELPKKAIASSSTRKSAPIVYQPEKKILQLNEYSKAAALLLNSLPQTLGAEQLLDDARINKKAKRMYVSENIEALVTTEIVAARSVVVEMTGYISMHGEAKRQPGGGGFIFLYDGLMKGTAGEDMGSKQELIVVDTRKKGNDTKLTRRSCVPNCVLKHVLGEQATLGVMMVATKDIPYNQEVTLPFDLDWGLSDIPLECADHIHNMGHCPFEIQRRQKASYRASERHAAEELVRKQKEEERAALEERRRLEDEVRRERAEMERKMDEEERLKKEEERAAQEAKKKQEREEAKKKKEAEKAERAARKASEEAKIEEEAKHEMQPTSSKSSNEPHKMSRDERLVQQAFRRHEEEQKRKEMMKAKALKKAEAAAKEHGKSKSKTPEPEKKEVQHEEPEASKPSESSSTASNKRASTRNSKPLNVEDAPTSSMSDTPRRSSKRHESIKSERTASPPTKRSRTSTIRDEATVKRTSTSKASTPASATKKVKNNAPKLTYKDLSDQLHQNALANTKRECNDFYPDASVLSEKEPTSQWVKIAKSSIGDDYKILIKERHVRIAREISMKKRKWAESAEERKQERKEMTRKTNQFAADLEKEMRDASEKKRTGEKRKLNEMLNASETADEAGPAPKAPVLAPEHVPGQPMNIEPEQQEVTSAPIETLDVELKEHGKVREASEPQEKESREGSEAKEGESKKSEKGRGPKKLTLDQYKQKRAVTHKDEATTSGTLSTSVPPRQGFIPSTDASSTANATLTTIYLEGFTGTAPSGPSTSDALNTRSKTRETASSISEDEPAAHNQSLADRVVSVFGLPTRTQAQHTSPAHNSPRSKEIKVRQRSTRWD